MKKYQFITDEKFSNLIKDKSIYKNIYEMVNKIDTKLIKWLKEAYLILTKIWEENSVTLFFVIIKKDVRILGLNNMREDFNE